MNQYQKHNIEIEKNLKNLQRFQKIIPQYLVRELHKPNRNNALFVYF